MNDPNLWREIKSKELDQIIKEQEAARREEREDFEQLGEDLQLQKVQQYNGANQPNN